MPERGGGHVGAEFGGGVAGDCDVAGILTLGLKRSCGDLVLAGVWDDGVEDAGPPFDQLAVVEHVLGRVVGGAGEEVLCL